MHENPYVPQQTVAQPGKQPWPASVKVLLGLVLLVLAVALFLPAVRYPQPAAYRMQCSNNLKQIALALHTYESVYKSFPPAYTVDAAGKPLHSWRTLLLPYLEYPHLYEAIDFAKPWDDPANATARNTEIRAFRCPTGKYPSTHTVYKAIVAPDAFFDPTTARKLSDVTDSISQTLMVIEDLPAASVEWMSPQDTTPSVVLSFDENAGFAHGYGTNAAFGDGHVEFLMPSLSTPQLRAMITIAGDDDAPQSKE